MSAWVYSLSSVVAVSLVSLIGLATLALGDARIRRIAELLMCFAVGTLLGDAFIHLIPEAFAEASRPLGPSLLILGGIFLFFIVEKLLLHRDGAQYHPRDHADETLWPELAMINMIGDAVHNFIDGALIGGSYLASPALGVSTTIAVLFHEIPQEIGDFGILLHSGLGVRRALWLNFAAASVAILGTILVLLVGAMAGNIVTTLLLPVTAGGFVYIVAADLIPELQHDRCLRALGVQASLISCGVAVMAILGVTE